MAGILQPDRMRVNSTLTWHGANQLSAGIVLFHSGTSVIVVSLSEAGCAPVTISPSRKTESHQMAMIPAKS
jgi:hypothetical protein